MASCLSRCSHACVAVSSEWCTTRSAAPPQEQWRAGCAPHVFQASGIRLRVAESRGGIQYPGTAHSLRMPSLSDKNGRWRGVVAAAEVAGSVAPDGAPELPSGAPVALLEPPPPSEEPLLTEEPEASPAPEESDRFYGLKAFVAGANGRLGRKIVEALVQRGVPVRALVRDAKKASYLRGLTGVEVVEGDVFKYETLQRGFGDSNVVMVATGATPNLLEPLGPFTVDYEGARNLVALAQNKGGVKKFVLVTSLGVDMLVNPVNVFWGILFWKKLAELTLQRSGLDYTIVRPGGLLSNISEDRKVVIRGPNETFGGGITRAKVAEICATALVAPEASQKVLEVVAERGARERSLEDWFATV